LRHDWLAECFHTNGEVLQMDTGTLKALETVEHTNIMLTKYIYTKI